MKWHYFQILVSDCSFPLYPFLPTFCMFEKKLLFSSLKCLIFVNHNITYLYVMLIQKNIANLFGTGLGMQNVDGNGTTWFSIPPWLDNFRRLLIVMNEFFIVPSKASKIVSLGLGLPDDTMLGDVCELLGDASLPVIFVCWLASSNESSYKRRSKHFYSHTFFYLYINFNKTVKKRKKRN